MVSQDINTPEENGPGCGANTLLTALQMKLDQAAGLTVEERHDTLNLIEQIRDKIKEFMEAKKDVSKKTDCSG